MASVNIYPTAVTTMSYWYLFGSTNPLSACYDANPATGFSTIYPASYPSSIAFTASGGMPANFIGATITAVSLYIWTDPQMPNRGSFTPYLILDGTTLMGTTQTSFVGGQSFSRPGGGSWLYTDFYDGGLHWGVAGTGNAGDNSKNAVIYEMYLQVTYTPATAPVAAFTVSTTTGTAPLTVQFTDQGTNTPTSWLWSFGDTQTSVAQHPLYVYTTVGTYTVTLTETNGGGSDDIVSASLITVLTAASPVDVAFNASPLSGVQNLGVQFTDYSQGTPVPDAWLWNFGDSSTSSEQHPLHTYTTVGTYTVTLTASNATPTTDTETKSSFITVGNGKPVPGAAASTTTGVRDLTVEFTGSATNAVPTSWLWEFGDGGGSVAQSPIHVYTTVGTFTPTLITGNAVGTASTTVGPITVGYETITASFTVGPTMGYIPMTSRFTDQSVGDGFSWAWEFGDGDPGEYGVDVTFYGQNPSHVFLTNPISEAVAWLTTTETVMSDDPDLRHCLRAYWKMEEATGTGDRDNFLGDAALDLTPSASASQVTGLNDYGQELTVGRSLRKAAGFTRNLPHSASGWFKTAAAAGDDELFSGFSASAQFPRVQRSGSYLKVTTDSGSTTGTTAITAATWYHVAYTFDGVDTHKMYLNGVLEITHTDSVLSESDGLIIGANSASASCFVDEAGYYTCIIGQDQITALYGAGAGLFFNPLAIQDTQVYSEMCPIPPDRTWGYFFEEMKYMLMEPLWNLNVCQGFNAFGGITKAVQLTQQRLQRFVLETRALRKEESLSSAGADTEDFELPTDLIELLRVQVDGVPYYPADPYQRDRESLGNVYILNDTTSITIPGVFGTTPTVKVWYTFVPSAPTVPAPCDCPTLPVPGPWGYFPLPYVLWWIVKYGVMADMLSQPGERNDLARATEAEKMWTFGVEIYKLLYRGGDE